MSDKSESNEIDIDDLKRRMEGAITVLKAEFGGLRTGRASISLLEPIVVEAYGSQMPITQVGTINVPEPRMLSVQVWDKTQVAAVEKAIRKADLGINPIIDGQNIRIPIPQLNEERRVELTKIANKYSEQARVAVRNVRRDGMETFKRMERDGEISQDEQRQWSHDIQKLTDETVKTIDEALTVKDLEIMQV